MTATALESAAERFLDYLRDVRQLSAHTVSNYRRDLASLEAYCRQCGSCLAQCDKGVEVPTLMRSYMYAYGYRNLAMAKEAVDSIDLSNIPCGNCGSCNVECAMGFDIKHKVEDIARLQHVPDDFVC